MEKQRKKQVGGKGNRPEDKWRLGGVANTHTGTERETVNVFILREIL